MRVTIGGDPNSTQSHLTLRRLIRRVHLSVRMRAMSFSTHHWYAFGGREGWSERWWTHARCSKLCLAGELDGTYCECLVPSKAGPLPEANACKLGGFNTERDCYTRVASKRGSSSHFASTKVTDCKQRACPHQAPLLLLLAILRPSQRGTCNSRELRVLPSFRLIFRS